MPESSNWEDHNKRHTSRVFHWIIIILIIAAVAGIIYYNNRDFIENDDISQRVQSGKLTGNSAEVGPKKESAPPKPLQKVHDSPAIVVSRIPAGKEKWSGAIRAHDAPEKPVLLEKSKAKNLPELHRSIAKDADAVKKNSGSLHKIDQNEHKVSKPEKSVAPDSPSRADITSTGAKTVHDPVPENAHARQKSGAKEKEKQHTAAQKSIQTEISGSGSTPARRDSVQIKVNGLRLRDRQDLRISCTIVCFVENSSSAAHLEAKRVALSIIIKKTALEHDLAAFKQELMARKLQSAINGALEDRIITGIAIKAVRLEKVSDE